MERLAAHPAIQLIGNPDPSKRIAILSFNIRLGISYLHPRFVAARGKYFLPLYDFDLSTGSWRHRGFPLPEPQFGPAEALAPGLPSAADDATPASGVPEQELDTTKRDLIPFVSCRR